MRMTKLAILIPLLVLLGACAPHRHDGWRHGGHHGEYGRMSMGSCGQGSCTYRSRCFSNGAIHANGGVCQACTDGRWAAASGCREDDNRPCPMMKGKGKKGPCCEGCPMQRGKPPARD